MGDAVEVVECEAGVCRLAVPNKTCSMDHFGPKKWDEMVRFARLGEKPRSFHSGVATGYQSSADFSHLAHRSWALSSCTRSVGASVPTGM